MVNTNVTGSAAPVTMSTDHVEGHLVVGLSGVVDSTTSGALQVQLMILLLDEQHRTPNGLIIDLTDTDLQDVVGLAQLMMTYWKTTSLDNPLRLIAPQDPTREALFTAGLDWLAPIYPTLEDAAADDAEGQPTSRAGEDSSTD